MKAILQFFRPSFTGPDGKASSKKLTMFAFMACYVFMIVSCRVWECNFPDIAYITSLAGALGVAAVGSYQNVGLAQVKKEKEIALPEE